jgi:predicted ATPase
MAELLRVKGELVLLENALDAAATAADHFRQAFDWARRQGALSWELTAAIGLARMWRNQDRSKEARGCSRQSTVDLPRASRPPISRWPRRCLPV